MKARNHNINWHDYFICDDSSPSGLRWKCSMANNKIKAESVAGNLRESAGNLHYWMLEVKSTSFAVHRIIWEMLVDKIPEGYIIDHLDGNGGNNKLENLSLKTPRLNSANKKKQCSNKSGVTGVSKVVKISAQGKHIPYWTASWVDINKKLRSKNFNIDKLGETEAFQLACKYRKDKIQELKQQGIDYTERHGL